MSEPLKELRAQRELIWKHLNWLDAQIRDAEGAASGHDEPDRTERPIEMSVRISERAPCSVEKPEEPPLAENIRYEVKDPLMEYSGGSDITRIKTGCIIFFAVVSLLFLFLLFGLPYLLD